MRPTVNKSPHSTTAIYYHHICTAAFRFLIRRRDVGPYRYSGRSSPLPSYLISSQPHTPHYNLSFSMPSKRKKSGMALLDRDPTVGDDLLGQDRPASGPRRSDRLLDKGQALNTGVNDVPVYRQTSPGRTRSRRRNGSWNEGTEVAVSALQKMEDDFRKDIKRQKIALKESEPRATATDAGHAAFMPRPTKEMPDVLPAEKEKEAMKRRADMGRDDGDYIDAAAEGDGQLMPGGVDPDTDLAENNVNVMKQEGARPPPVNSDYLPLPWKGRLGYACLNTYLRNSNPPVFSSRTCRISSILENRHPLQDPSQPAHATKNRPDRSLPAEVERGQKHVEALGLANAKDITKMLRWNDKYGIKFMRLSSEMFPFASHEEYGYRLAPFASEVLAEAGRVAGELGHRLTTHPGQFTQLGSPRSEVVRNSIRDLEYHNEMLTLLRLPEQQDRDAVMIIHMGGVFGDKAATLDRFRQNYSGLSDEIKARLVLENDDVSWTVHDLLPICEELNIPLVLDYHHHNILFDKDKVREGTKDIMELYPRIKATWDRKGITQKMHYSEPCPDAVTPRQRRKHRPRVMTLPPCPNDMDLMIEAKDKEQAVFDLMRNFKLPGWDTFNDVVPYEREDENRPPPKMPKKRPRKKKAKGEEEMENTEPGDTEEPKPPPQVSETEFGMGGPNNRVYWPIGMEEWLRPKKREVKKKQKTNDDIDMDEDEDEEE
ncbi:UV-endonuclease UvdE-domain-containing protein [Poronia punctata]|nr:UV-endonuclease UvdE-domain-containing protein [Poronia punctata]